MKSMRKTSKNSQQTVVDNQGGSIPGVDSDSIIPIHPSVQLNVEPSSISLYEPQTVRITRSRRNTFTYGQAGEGSSSQLHDIDNHHELVPYSNKEWTVILRNENAGQLVLYNAANRRVSVRRLSPRNDSSQPQALTTPQACIFCRRPFEAANHMPGSLGPDFMHRNYFRLLENSESIQPEAQPTFCTHTVSSHSSAEFSTATSSTNQNFAAHSTLSQSSFNQGYYERFFIEEKKLGRGFRGSVYLCKHVLDNVHLGEYAIKKVAVGNNHSWLVRMLREVHLLERLHHPNIVDYKHAWLEYHQLTKFGPQVPCLFILMECANRGNLEEYVDEQPSTFAMQQGSEETNQRVKERVLRARKMRQAHEQSSTDPSTNIPLKRYLELPEIWSLFIDICEGLSHLHRHGIVHRDLKPSNLLLHYDEGKTGIPKVLISDFGECELLDQLSERDRTGATGTLEFMAPELLTVDERGKYYKDYSQKSDMWSLGMVLYYLCYSRLPYRQVDDVDLLKQEILHFEGVSFPENTSFSSRKSKIPQQLRSLIKRLLSRNKKSRPSCDEILKSVEDIRPNFPTNAYNETPVSLSNQGVAGPPSGLESPVSSNNSTTTRVTANKIGLKTRQILSELASDVSSSESVESNEVTNLRRRKKVEKGHIFQETQEITSEGSGIEDLDIGQSSSTFKNGQIHDNNKAAIVRVVPSRSSLYQITYYLGMSSSQMFEGKRWQLIKFIIVVVKIITCVRSCSPYLPSPWVLYPIIIFAILDIYTKRRTYSLVLGGIHIIWIMIFTFKGTLCNF